MKFLNAKVKHPHLLMSQRRKGQHHQSKSYDDQRFKKEKQLWRVLTFDSKVADKAVDFFY
jgi:hypothetical protein